MEAFLMKSKYPPSPSSGYIDDELDSDEIDEEDMKLWCRYYDEVEKSENFEVGDYPYPGTSIRHPHRPAFTGYPVVAKVYDASHYPCPNPVYDASNQCPNASHRCPNQGVDVDMFLCFSRLAICFYNIREGTYFRNVKVLMATERGLSNYENYITFQASSGSRRNRGSVVTFQTHILVFRPKNLCPKFQIMFVRIKPDGNNAKKSQPSEYDPKAQVVRYRLFQVLKKYDIDSRLDSRYNLALYLCQYALVCHNLHVLQEEFGKHDMESLKVLKLVKSFARDPTYRITFEAPLRAETQQKNVETFETEICMPSLFPTTKIELKSEARVITGNFILQHIISVSHGVNYSSCYSHLFSV